MAPQTVSNVEEIRISRSAFDLDSKSDVDLVKTGTFQPVADMSEFVARLGNDSTAILTIVNDGLKEFTRKQLQSASDIPWKQVLEDGTVTDFSGTLLSPEKSEQFQKTVLAIAKLQFGYPDEKLPKGSTPDQQKANRELKASAKAQAQDMLLASPVTVEALKK